MQHLVVTRLPFDSEPCDPGFRIKDVPSNALDDRLRGWLRIELFSIVFVVHVIAHPYKFPSIIGACKKDDRYTNDLRWGYFREIGRIGFEEELVDPDWNWSDKEGV